MSTITEQIAQARDKAESIPNHYRDEDGVWHDGPYKAEFLAALDRIEQHAARMEQALREARDWISEEQETLNPPDADWRGQLLNRLDAALANRKDETA